MRCRIVGIVNQRLGLLDDGVNDVRIAVTKVLNANTTNKIDIAAVIVVPNSGIFAFDER